MANETTGQYPELLVIAGPDEGRRIRLESLPVRMGRSAKTQVQLKDQFASREQVEFGRGPDGFIVTVLSSKGQAINDEIYKRGKQVLLASGDVLKIGVETEILFAAPGDDVDEVHAALLQRRQGEPAPAEHPESAEEERPPAPPPEPERIWAAGPEAETGGEQDRVDPGHADAIEARRKRNRIIMGLAIYAGAMLLGGLALKVLLGDPERDPRAGMPPKFSQDQIAAALSPAPEDALPSFTRASEALDEARELYVQRQEPGNRYRSIAAYNEYMAYAPATSLPELTDQTHYSSMREQLLQEIVALYYNGYAAMQAGRWAEAQGRFNQIRREVPDPANPLYRNVINSLDYIRERTAQPRDRDGMPW